MSKKIERVLIANRGEIACRVVRSCRALGIESVTLFTEKEKELPHASAGNISVSLGEGSLAETYLNIPKIIDICKQYKIDAVHPGYGFLSENSQFAKTLEDNDIILIGPSAASMDLMGDKKASKISMEKLGIPVIPGYHGDDQSVDTLKVEAKKIGTPLLIKATAGGGGKGMRVVYDLSEVDEALESAKREAMNAFGNDQVLLERYIQNPRHIEVQVLSDSHGNHFHLFERECSIQRRHQKIIEESPSVALDNDLRNRMTADATKISEHINYLGAGTIEYILDEDGSYYFLEMNTRLQVEHPITEAVTGVDLVKEQIRVAQGETISFKQEDIKQTGHALEVRLYAEDPDNNFLPSIGKISYRGFAGSGVRLDTGYNDQNEVTIDYDPMLAKVIVHRSSRNEAINDMKDALLEIPFMGVKTNREYLSRVLTHKKFLEGVTFTHFVKTFEDDLGPIELSQDQNAQAIAAHLLTGNYQTYDSTTASPWESLDGFRN